MDLAHLIISGMEEEEAFDQPCAYGHRCGGHAVYCCNDDWKAGPRKCRRTWYTGGKTKDEDCEGYKPNSEYKIKEVINK